MHSESIAELAVALVKAQAKIAPAEKDARGNYGKYTTLRSVWEACKSALHENGFSVLQFAEPSDTGTLALTTMLLHSSGQWIQGTETVRLQKDDPQGYGSAITYLRRYGLAAMAGVAPEDDDAAVASKPARGRVAPDAPQSAVQPQQPVLQQPTPIRPPVANHGLKTPKQGATDETAHRWFCAAIKERFHMSPDQAKKLLGVDSITQAMGDLTYDQILEAIKAAIPPTFRSEPS